MNRSSQAKLIRIFRKIHRISGLNLVIFILVIAISGILLGWKKNSNGYILPPTQKGTTTEVSNWLSFDSLKTIACQTMFDSVGPALPVKINKIDARPDKGVVKFVFDGHYKGIQLDAATGEVLQVATRRSDLIENIHDGSVLDKAFGTGSGIIKIIYTSIMGVSLVAFSITGLWIWYGPKKIKNRKRARKK
ncbi:putative iron-regulated membrane protein [Salinivirga cyanobacteriivorans]|uniref:Putative iron-regulated membrane protein n=1 Tax=Salinivirga cyanobacteriivorans TaxID=1307839 RepID=A0A0S2I029_9BACT|nr:PepSY-associated TM helix domain-containing protein [Salinivirga cyanobacteriivorans]ALO15688.1 putative iron-regulated membrane protein [Salinivirga cyanobacteriivorans]